MRFRTISLVYLLVAAVVAVAPAPGQARTIGEMIDDAAIVASVTAKLTADKLSNLTKIDVKSDGGVVTLGGTVDSQERRARAVQIASGVSGVKTVINNIQVAGGRTTASAPPVTPSPGTPSVGGEASVDATGTVARVDPATGTITLADGRVLRTTGRTVVWQPSTVEALKPGTQVLVRGATAAGFETTGASSPREWRMGTVSRVDRGSSQLVLTDGTVVRVTPSTTLLRGTERLSLDQLEPGSEVVVRVPPTLAASTVDASQVDVVWSPAGGGRQ